MRLAAQSGFVKTREGLVGRPWCIDDLDAVLRRFKRVPHRKAMLFVDNAGSDVVLGGPQKHWCWPSPCEAFLGGITKPASIPSVRLRSTSSCTDFCTIRGLYTGLQSFQVICVAVHPVPQPGLACTISLSTQSPRNLSYMLYSTSQALEQGNN